jgi:O-antigen/teichoic acid export membrane protein
LFANSVQAALITHPHQSLAPGRAPADRPRYTTATGMQQIVLAAAMGLFAAAAAAVAAAAGWDAAGLLLMLALAVAAWQLQEFARRVLYSEGRLAMVWANDAVSYGGQLLGIVVLWRTDTLTATTALGVLAATSAAGAVLGGWQIRDQLVRGVNARRHLPENWSFGKWLLGSTIAMWTSSQLYPLMTAGFVSVAATGALRAVWTILGPTHILLKAVDTAFTPLAAKAYGDGGGREVASLVRATYLITGPIMLGYCALVSLLAHPLLNALYGGRYNDYDWLLPLLAACYGLVYVYTPIWVALRGMQVTAPMFRGYVFSTFIVLTAGVGLVYYLGVLGAALGMIIHGVVLCAVLWRSYRSAVANSPQTAAPRVHQHVLEVARVDL